MAKAKFINSKEKMPRMTYFKSIVKSLIFTLAIMLILAAIITFTSVSESIMPLITSIIIIFSIAFSGLLSAKEIRKNGFIHGLFTGAIYILFILILSWILIKDFSIDKFAIIKGIIGIIAGGIGGMIGVNLK
ncbi:TIGR04086 family membrane protein [Maledivibacter halophilus]|uniref:Putative membrane protein, TIGR04086 family n=1 Tax=Maledivibacter halophilus TaxID=36842 RepID=A0A1T5L427_9FIRM|nr:TIGR04086 family membrane protein [Maledivibacter halophilus]SKC70168.1 putative membrane protein, TIGR04086 family [Maledivibacter halophilus]